MPIINKTWPNWRQAGELNDVLVNRDLSTSEAAAGLTESDINKAYDPGDVRRYGAVGDGVTDDATAIQSAVDSGHEVLIPDRTFKCNSVITTTSDLIMTGLGEQSVLDFTGTVTGGNYPIYVQGSLTQIQDLGSNGVKGSTSITFASAPSLSVGSVFVIFNPTNSSFSGFRTEYRAGEYCEVESISGSLVTLKSPLYDDYVVANVDVYVMASPVVELRNFKITGTTVLGLINTSRCIAPVMENITATHENNSVIFLDRCFRPTVINPNIRNIGDGGNDYGILVGSSQHSRIFGGNVYARRHAITHGGGAETGDVPVRDSKISGSVLKNDPASGVHNADWHGNAEGCQFIDCTIYGGATWQGKDNGYVNCDIYNYEGTELVVIKSSEILGGKHYAYDCRITDYGDPSSGVRGVVDVGGNSNAITSSTTEDSIFSLKNCVVTAPALSSSTSIMSVRNRGTTSKVNVDIDDLTLNVNDMARVLFMDNVSGTADSDYIIVDNIKTSLNGKIIASIDSNYLAFPMRMQEFHYSEEVTTSTSSPTVTGTSTAYKFIYPKIPVVSMSRSARGYAGNRIGIAYANPISATALTPNISTDDATNFSSAVTVTLNWTVGVKEV